MMLSVLRLLAIPICFALFLKGFFPLKEISSGYSTKKITPRHGTGIGNNETSFVLDPNLSSPINSTFPRPYQRLVLMIIDALRNDFVHGPFDYLPLTNLLLRGHGLSFTAQTHPPTVTLPRIKAITTGTIPGFVDVVLNFGSTALLEDNIVTQMKINNKKVVFYGDDTWINLFPSHFYKHDGTSSFFVTDYTEVDDNVTRHLSSQLQPDVDWDVMILHYLGLDHIGHLSGPNSPLIRPKLAEMDGIIGKMYTAMQTWEKSNISSLLVVCGDHGMSDQGGHGGSSPSEVLVPIIFLSPSIMTKESINKGLVSQTDLCPTLAMLLGLPIPINSLGRIITHTLVGYSLPQKVSVLHQNVQQVLKVFRTFVTNLERESAYTLFTTGTEEYKKWLNSYESVSKEEWERHGQRILGFYSESLSLMAEKVGKLSSRYDIYVMTASITLLWLLLLSLLISQLKKDLTLPKASLTKHLIQIVPILGSVLMSHITMCTAGVPSILMCGSSPFSIGVQLLVAVILVSSMLHVACARSRLSPWKEQIMHLFSGNNIIDWFLLVATVMHTFTLLSSSFVEEEHQTFYFLTTSVHVLLLGMLSFRFLKSYRLFHGEHVVLNCFERKEQYDSITQEVDSRYSEGNNGTEDNENNEFNETSKVSQLDVSDNCDNDFQSISSGDIYKEVAPGDRSRAEHHEKGGNSEFVKHCKFISRQDALHVSVSLGLILVFLRMLRRWNQIGNKWLDLPDFGDWLVNPDNKPMLSFAVVFSLMIVGASRSVSLSKLQTMCVNLSLMLSYMSRAAGGTLIFPDRRFISNRGVPEARASYFFLVMTVFLSILPLHRFQNNNDEEKDAKDSNRRTRKSKAISDDTDKSFSTTTYRHPNSGQQSLKERKEIPTPGLKDLFSVKPESHSSFVNMQDKRVHIVNGILTAWLCFMCLVLRPHNIPIVAMMSLLEQMAVHVLIKLELKTTSVLLYCLWMGHAFFFFQGNSNSLSTVDISAGYVGITEYTPVIIGLLMALSTYSGLIFWMLSFLKTMCRLFPGEGNVRLNHVLQQSFNCLVLKMIFPLAVYCIVVSTQRYHLFVWTVFSPKLLYQGMETLVSSSIALCFYGITFYRGYFL